MLWMIELPSIVQYINKFNIVTVQLSLIGIEFDEVI